MRLEDIAKERRVPYSHYAGQRAVMENGPMAVVMAAAPEMLALLLEQQAGAERTAQSLAEWKGKRNALIARLRSEVEGT